MDGDGIVTVAEETCSFSYVVQKRILLRKGDLLRDEKGADLLICSAFSGNYRELRGTMIGALGAAGIHVAALAAERDRRFDVSDDSGILRAWASRPIDHPAFRRIGCVELKALSRRSGEEWERQESAGDLLKNAFSGLRGMVEEMARAGMAPKRIVMTMPGTGSQKIEACYVAPALLSQCRAMLNSVRELEEIAIYARRDTTLAAAKDALGSGRGGGGKQVFISYSSKDSAWAERIYRRLREQRIACWKAPEDIPAGSNYQKEIPRGLQETFLLISVLTQNTERSSWCYKEIGTAIGCGHIVLPVQLTEFELSEQFKFLMDGEQIFPAYAVARELGEEGMIDKLTRIVLRFIRNHEIYAAG